MKKSYQYIIRSISFGLFILTGFSSCKKYLEEPPSKTTSLVVTTTDQLSALLNNYTQFYAEGNRTAIYSTDDYELPKSLYDARPATFSSMATIQFMLWDIPYLPDDTREGFWSGEYKKIFYANMALDYVDKVTGPDADKAAIKADAHLIRAYSYWELANTYCLPYTDANKNEAGLPIKLSTSFEEPFVRQPLSKVYELIESDITEALKTTVPLQQGAQVRHWRASKAGVNGFAARYYLNRNNYAKAITHANAALAEYSTLVNHESWWYIPSQNLLNLYDQTNDLRYRYHIVEGYSYDRGLAKPSYNYPGYIFFFKDRIPSGPTVAEMYLIKAEALARTNDVAGAMTAVNTLRAKRMLPGAWVNLSAINKDDAIKKVAEERRREMPFVQRWYDLRRYNNNEDPNDDVNLSKTFYPYTNSAVLSTQPVQSYTLPKGSRRWAAPLPRTEIISSDGVIEQNTY